MKLFPMIFLVFFVYGSIIWTIAFYFLRKKMIEEKREREETFKSYAESLTTDPFSK